MNEDLVKSREIFLFDNKNLPKPKDSLHIMTYWVKCVRNYKVRVDAQCHSGSGAKTK